MARSLAGATQDEVRQHNLASVLRLVHLHGSLSRSDISTATGLNRSTVGALITNLATAGLVYEHQPEDRGVGRPSHGGDPLAGADRVPDLQASPHRTEMRVQRVHLDAVELVTARRGRVETPDHVHQRAFAAPRRPHDGHHFAVFYAHRHVVERNREAAGEAADRGVAVVDEFQDPVDGSVGIGSTLTWLQLVIWAIYLSATLTLYSSQKSY